MKFIRIMAFSLLVTITAQAKNYYFSENGKNTNSGLTPSKSLLTIDKLNTLKLKAGDSVLFKCNDKFVGEIIVNNSGTKLNPIVFSSYGKGQLPVISGAIRLKNSDKSNNRQLFFVPTKISNLYINGKKQTLARYPNSGYLTMGKGIDSIGFVSTLSEHDGYWEGASIGMRTIDWVFEHRKVASFKNKELKFCKNSIYKITNGYGYYLMDKPQLIDSIGEWYSDDNRLQIMSNENLNEQHVEAVIYKNAFVLKPTAKHIVIKALCIDKYAQSGIWAKEGSGNIEISNNKISHLGLMGIWLDTLVSNVHVKANSIEDIAGRGISGIRNKNCNIEYNTIKRIGLFPGEGVSGVNGMEGIVIENEETNQKLSTAFENRIAYNLVDSTGYAGIRMDGKNSVCEFNIVKNTSLKLNDSGAIYCFGKVQNRTQNNSISNNLILNAVGNIEATPSNGIATNGIYVDNNSTEILLENNTIINVSSSGIHVNDAAPRNTLKNNTIYNCASGICFAEWANKDSLYGCVIDKNIVLAKDKSQYAITILTFLGPKLNPGTFSNNRYVNFHDDFVISYRTDPEKGHRRSDMIRLENWQRIMSNEKGSVSTQQSGAQLIYNESFTAKEIAFPNGVFSDIEGKLLPIPVLLEPCASLLIYPTNH